MTNTQDIQDAQAWRLHQAAELIAEHEARKLIESLNEKLEGMKGLAPEAFPEAYSALLDMKIPVVYGKYTLADGKTKRFGDATSDDLRNLQTLSDAFR